MLKELLEYEERVKQLNEGVDRAIDKASQQEPEPAETKEGKDDEKPVDGEEVTSKKED